MAESSTNECHAVAGKGSQAAEGGKEERGRGGKRVCERRVIDYGKGG